MTLCFSLCISLILSQMVFGTPFPEGAILDSDNINTNPKSSLPIKWTDMIYYNNNNPNQNDGYMEYDNKKEHWYNNNQNQKTSSKGWTDLKNSYSTPYRDERNVGTMEASTDLFLKKEETTSQQTITELDNSTNTDYTAFDQELHDLPLVNHILNEVDAQKNKEHSVAVTPPVGKKDQKVIPTNTMVATSNDTSAVAEIAVSKEREENTDADDMYYKSLIQEQIERAENPIRSSQIQYDSKGSAHIDDDQEKNGISYIYREGSTTSIEPVSNSSIPKQEDSFRAKPLFQPPPPPPPSLKQPLPPSSFQPPPQTRNNQQQKVNNGDDPIATTAATLNNVFYKLVQQQPSNPIEEVSILPSNRSAETMMITKAGSMPITTQSVTQDGTTTLFDPSNKIKLPNGGWTPSCKNVSKGSYCMEPDGEDSTIIECLGENVGFQFSCGSKMKCYSVGPFDVDCQIKK